MKYTHIKITLASVFTMFVVGFLVAQAAPSFFAPGQRSQTATSSVTNVVSGATAVTLFTYDAFATGRNLAADNATLLIQTTASSTATTITITPEYSQDGIDWYQNNVERNFVQTGTTTQTVFDVSSPIIYRFTAATTTRFGKAINVETPTRFVRFLVNGTGANGTVWAELVPKRESGN